MIAETRVSIDFSTTDEGWIQRTREVPATMLPPVRPSQPE